MNVAIIGASDDPERYSYQALILLKENSHVVFPVHLRLESIEGVKVYRSMKGIPIPVDTVTMYVGARTASAELVDAIITAKPRRIILNPGAENAVLEDMAAKAGIEVVQACTLVMLRTGQF